MTALGPGAAVLRLRDHGIACGAPELRALIVLGQVAGVDGPFGPAPLRRDLDRWIRRQLRAQRDRTAESEGVVYLIRVGRLTKIGHTRDLDARLRRLRTLNAGRAYLLETHEGDRRLEAALHREFASDRDHGEWFRLVGDWRRRVRLVVADYVLEGPA